MKNNLNQYQKNIYSQFGEDGIIEEVLARIGQKITLDNWCVEFGAWDGVYLSNTCSLIKSKNYSAVLIEGDPKKVEQLAVNLPQENVHKVCKFVHFDGDSTLEKILFKTPLPKEFDFLSIDIDGVDYYILEGLNEYRPKVICIEFNPSIPNQVDFVQAKDFSIKQGSSAKAIKRLANSKGYQLVATTTCNLILVRDDLHLFVIDELPTLEDLNTQGNDPQYLFVGYDGTILSNKNTIKLIWQYGIEVPISNFQFLPIFLRVFGSDYSSFKKLILFIFLIFKTPKIAINKAKNLF
jgi:hypothetical protein